MQCLWDFRNDEITADFIKMSAKKPELIKQLNQSHLKADTSS